MFKRKSSLEKRLKKISKAINKQIRKNKKLEIFKLTSTESQAYRNFKLEHFNKGCDKGISVIITPTGVANNIEVKCQHCGESKDITDYDSW